MAHIFEFRVHGSGHGVKSLGPRFEIALLGFKLLGFEGFRVLKI